MNEQIDIERERTLGEIIRDSIALYRSNFGAFLVLAIVVIAPIELVVFGIGLGQLSGEFIATPSQGAQVLELGVQFLLVTPLLTAMTVLLLRDEQRSPARAARGGLELFGHVFVVMVLFALVFSVGLFALIVPAFIVAVRLGFGVQAVVVDGCRGVAALKRSWELTRGSFWRVLGISVMLNILSALLGALIAIPMTSIAQSANAGAIALAGTIIAQVIALPPAIIGSTLLFYDLHHRRAALDAAEAAEAEAPDAPRPPVRFLPPV